MYDITKYLNEHPGGPEIMLEFAGKDADDMFEGKDINCDFSLSSRNLFYIIDIGHSSEARTMMKKYVVGNLKVSIINRLTYSDHLIVHQLILKIVRC